MRLSDRMTREVLSDLGLNNPYIKGMEIPVRNCWHFSTDGNAVDVMFQDDEDFRCGMNRVYFVVRKYNVIILAFCLMDTHVHFILYGKYDECLRFMHEYKRRTSQYLSGRYGDFKKLKDVPVSHQAIDTQSYLKTCICYVIKNPPVGGLHFCWCDYPWSSGPLMFRHGGYWSSPSWTETQLSSVNDMLLIDKKREFHTHSTDVVSLKVIKGIIFPEEYVAVDIAESIFKTHKSFLYFMCRSKDSDVESREGYLSRLSIPLQEMRQHKAHVCMELFGCKDVRNLDIAKRLQLARTLRSRYDSSLKQIARLCGLKYSEALPFLK